MKALQYRRIGAPPEIVEIPRPEVGPGQVSLRVTAAGLCHSDLHIMSASEDEYRYGPLPLTLGHEAAGVVAATGAGADQFAVGEAVLVYGPWGCGICANCAQGKENYGTHPDEPPTGDRPPGALAGYLLVEHERHLVPLGGLDPVQAVSLTDAGLTSYHAVRPMAPKLGPASTAVVIGSGGRGHAAIQIITALTPATVIAVDISADKLGLARSVGPHHVVPGGDHAAGAVRDLTEGGNGAQAVLDFLGGQHTLELAGGVVGGGRHRHRRRRRWEAAGRPTQPPVRRLSARLVLGKQARIVGVMRRARPDACAWRSRPWRSPRLRRTMPGWPRARSAGARWSCSTTHGQEADRRSTAWLAPPCSPPLR